MSSSSIYTKDFTLPEYPKLPKHLYLWSLEYNHADLEESQNFLRISSMGEKNT